MSSAGDALQRAMEAHQETALAIRQEQEHQVVRPPVDWRHVFDTRSPHSPQNHDEIEAVLLILQSYNYAPTTLPQVTLPYLARACARRIEDMRS